MKAKADVVGTQKQEWFYSEKVKEHFFNPKNIFKTQKESAKYKADGIGTVGSPACGDVMKIWIKVDKKTDRIKECKWQTFGCASAIASTSILSVMVSEKGGMKIDKALKITPQDIIKRLGGLPDRKIHCSVLGDKALRLAINDFFEKTKQFSRMIDEGTRIVDDDTGITNKDIEQAVLDGAKNFADLQKRTKIAIRNKKIVPEIKRLFAYYKKKHFGSKFS